MPTHTVETAARAIARRLEWFDGPMDDPCWVFRANRGDRYARFMFRGKPMSVHRWMYEHVVGPIPTGMTIDHLCRVRLCANPRHMEPVTNKENVLRGNGPTAVNARKVICKRGHPFASHKSKAGSRQCTTCAAIRGQERYKRAALAALKERPCPENS